MSSKTKTTVTQEEAKPALVPKLRFPEFRGAWDKKTLETLGYFTGGGTPSKDNAAYWAGEIPWISSSDLNEDSISQINISRFITKLAVQESATKLVPAKSILLISRVGVGKLAVSTFPLCTSQDFTNFTPTDAHPLFLAYLLKSQRETLLSFNQGTSIKGFTKDNIASLRLGFPSPAEQQKIAECLSSVDELMTAQVRKVDVLKTHKKGLMQQLFPREGETQPRLRFPEFQSAGDWEEGKLISLSRESLSNGVFNDPKKVGTGYKLINVSDMYIETTIDESRLSLLELSPSEFEGNQVLTGDIFFTRSSLVKSGIAVSNIYLGSSSDVTYDGHLIRFRANTSKVVPLFAHYLFKTALIRAQLIARGKTATMTTIGQADVASVTLFYPGTKEQQRIASCLSRLDALITAETQKHEALKTHKKGLMQKLFPSLEEVDA